MSRRTAPLAFLFLIVLCHPGFAQSAQPSDWRFAVSGDSRNCGDIVMPAIAQSVLSEKPEFYWHLGDFRAGYKVDEDMSRKNMSPDEYRDRGGAWKDFQDQQQAAFDHLPMHLAIGNHEVYLFHKQDPDKKKELENQQLSHDRYVEVFGPAYTSWTSHGVLFISLDNSMNTGFDEKQVEWFNSELAKIETNDSIKTVVVGMHRALPNSLACGHSMNGDPESDPEDNRKSTESGRAVYKSLWKLQHDHHKHVYVLASHSHFYIEHIYDTPYWNDPLNLGSFGQVKPEVLEGYLVGTAGARRYRLPDDLPPNVGAITYAYGYLLGTVAADGTIRFRFKQIVEDNVPSKTRKEFGDDLIHYCFYSNRESSGHKPADSCNEQ